MSDQQQDDNLRLIPRSAAVSVNTELCKMFGLDPKTTREVNVTIKAGEYPTLIVRSVLRDIRPIEEFTTRYELIPLPPFDGEVETTVLGDVARSFALKKDMAPNESASQ